MAPSAPMDSLNVDRALPPTVIANRVQARAATAVQSASAALALALSTASVAAQSRLSALPGYSEYQRIAASRPVLDSIERGIDEVRWSVDGRSIDFDDAGKHFRYSLAANTAVLVSDSGADTHRLTFDQEHPGRGRQFGFAVAPVGNHRAIYKDGNVWLGDSAGDGAVPITQGGISTRIRYGTASWVYGEELSQRTAMWWSPDGTRLAFYRFDERDVHDFYVTTDLTSIQDSLDTEAYPVAGASNPVVDIYVYDLATKRLTRIDVRDGHQFANDALGYYVFRVTWSPDGRELMLLRTNRRQNRLELVACATTSGRCRVVVREENPAGWIDDDPAPTITWLKDGNRFLWDSDRSGFKNYYLYNYATAELIDTVTRLKSEVAGIVRVDEDANTMYYVARDGDNYMKLQLHRVSLDGTNDTRLTDPALTHTVSLSPDAKYFVDVAQAHAQPPAAYLVRTTGEVVARMATTGISKLKELGVKPAEMYTYQTSDGRAKLHGLIHYPSNFDPRKTYPLLVSVYGGPGEPNTTTEDFQVWDATTEFGFIELDVEARTNPGMGRNYLNDVYMKLGQVEQDDMADGVKAIWNRPYIDKARIGIYGTSYGGYTAVMELLRYPDVFAAASASSPVTDWRNYDSIYTERYMWIPQENKDGYDRGSALTYAKDLQGRLQIYFGTADNNVHPSNTVQLIQALQRAGKDFDVRVGPDQMHGGLDPVQELEFFANAFSAPRSHPTH